MLRRSAASPAFRRILLAVSLCVLTLAFAIEAKAAWYGPEAGLNSGISSAKALPIDSPKLVHHGVPTPDPVHPQIPYAIVTILAAAWPIRPTPSLGRITLRSGFKVSSAAYFSYSAFLRPPPVL